MAKKKDAKLYLLGRTYDIIPSPKIEVPKGGQGYIDYDAKEIWITENPDFSRNQVLLHEAIHHTDLQENGESTMKEKLVDAIARDLCYALMYNPCLVS